MNGYGEPAKSSGCLPTSATRPQTRAELVGLVERHRLAAIREQRLVAPHARRPPADEDETVRHSAMMLSETRFLGPAPIAVIVPVGAGEAPPPGDFL